MLNMVSRVGCCVVTLFFAQGVAFAQGIEVHTADEVVSQCDYKSLGADQRSMLAVTLINATGAEKKSVYRRLWKAAESGEKLLDKMVLYTVFPPEGEGTGFLRWGYKAEVAKVPDQWLYLPTMKKTKRVSVRDPGDSFLGSDLSYGDIDDRAVTADRHQFVSEYTTAEYYVVDSVPVAEPKLYSKRRSWFKRDDGWDNCVRTKTEYYDGNDDLLKVQELSWQSDDGRWAWDKVSVKNVQSGHSSIFRVFDVEYDVGLSKRMFTERALQRGYRE